MIGSERDQVQIAMRTASNSDHKKSTYSPASENKLAGVPQLFDTPEEKQFNEI